MPLLDPTTASIDTLSALQSTIALELRKRRATVADIPALRAVVTKGASGTTLLDQAITELVPVTGGVVWKWSAYSTAADDGTTVVQPTDRATGAGRWLATTSTIATGYLRAVRIYEGDEAEHSFLERLLVLSPAVGIVWKDETGDKESIIPGAYYRVWMNAELWCASRNFRAGNEAFMGSGVSTEAAADPGVLKIIGDVRSAVAGSDLGLTDGIDYVYPGAHRPKWQSLAERQFVHALAIRIPMTLRFNDTDGGDVVIPNPGGLQLHGQQVLSDGVTLDELNPGSPDQVPAPT